MSSELQPLPILSRLMVHGSRRERVDPRSNRIQPYWLHAVDVDYYKSFTRVALAPHQRVDSPKGAVNALEFFGQLMLPFPRLWIEWETSLGVRSAAECHLLNEALDAADMSLPNGDADLERVARLRKKIKANDWVLTLHVLDSQTGDPRETGISLVVYMSDDGTCENLKAHVGGAAGDEDLDPQMRLQVALGGAFDALVAIGWMNCRNVSLAHRSGSSGVSRKASKRQRKAAKRAVDYHTIELPGPKRNGTGGGNRDGSGDVRLHKVRGHFKHYTADAPLLGKHTGTYWWGWAVRGNPDKGEVISDYLIAEPKEA